MPRNYRASGKRAQWDWKPAMDRELLAVRIQPHTERYRGSPSCFSEVAEKYGRTIRACTTRYYNLRKRQGEIGFWTDVGLWTPEEDNLILAQIPLYGRVAYGTWIQISEILTNRTLAAIRVRAFNLKRRLWGKRYGGK